MVIARNEDVVAVDVNQECRWIFESTAEGETTVRQAEKRSWDLLEAVMDLCRGFIRSTKARIVTLCLNPEERYTLEKAQEGSETYLDLQNQAGVTFEEMSTAVDEVGCEADLMTFTRSVYFTIAETKLYVDGENRWIDRDSEQLVYWSRDGDNQRQPEDLEFDRSVTEPIIFGVHQYDSDDHLWEIKIETESDIWWADTEAGRVNGHRLWEFLRGLADLDLITDGRMITNRGAVYDFVDDIEYFHTE